MSKSGKYTLTEETKIHNGVLLTRIKGRGYFRYRTGGFVETERNLSQDGESWIDSESMVYGNARVSGNAYLSNSEMFEESYVFDRARLKGCKCWGNSKMGGDCRLFDSEFSGNSYVSGTAQVTKSKVGGEAILSSGACLAEGSFCTRVPMVISDGFSSVTICDNKICEKLTSTGSFDKSWIEDRISFYRGVDLCANWFYGTLRDVSRAAQK